MNLKSAWGKISKGEWYYLFSRFQTVRKIYSGYRRFKERGLPVPPKPDPAATLFPTALDPETLKTLQKDSVAFGFNLPAALVAEILGYARNSPGIGRPNNTAFHYSEVKEGLLPNGSPIALGTILNADQCPAVQKIMTDPGLLDVTTRYLGYRPRQAKPRLFWSFVTPFTEEQRIKVGQTIFFHFDVDGYNFSYANFYLTDVDSKSGAHVMMKGTHKKKPLGMLFHSANQPDEAVWAQFGKENQLLIEGPAGTGFIQDSSCYHKATVPEKRERLMLQIRFS
jgi:hypothetical protein